jgi:uroporphyrinogen decarboxylase
MKIDMKQWREDIMQSDARYAFPIMTYAGLDLTGFSVLDVVRDGEIQAQCMQVLAARYPLAGFVTIMDLSVEAEAFGAQVKFAENETPTVIGQLVPDRSAAQALNIPEVGTGRTRVYLDAAGRAAASIPDRPVFGCLIGPFSLAGRLSDMTRIFVNLLSDPGMVHIVLDKCTQFLIDYAKAYKKAGTQGIFIAEPAAGLISPEQCDEFSSRYVRRIVAAVQDEHFMVVLHNCGNTKKLVPSMLSTQAQGLHFGNTVNLIDILPQMPDRILAFGNLDPATVFKQGTPAEVKAKTRALLESMAGCCNFVPSSGCDIPPGTPISSIEAFFEAVDEYNVHNRPGCAG